MQFVSGFVSAISGDDLAAVRDDEFDASRLAFGDIAAEVFGSAAIVRRVEGYAAFGVDQDNTDVVLVDGPFHLPLPAQTLAVRRQGAQAQEKGYSGTHGVKSITRGVTWR